MKFEVMESRQTQGEWRVEAIDTEGDGEIFVTLFSGREAEERAREYAESKSARSRREPQRV